MKKILCLSLAAVLAIALSACAGKEEAPSASVAFEASNTPQASIEAPGVQLTEAPSEQIPTAQASSGPIIAESSNTVSDKETEEILDKLSAELENALSGAENLEDLENTDLDTGNIE